jgi:hypothetical protein
MWRTNLIDVRGEEEHGAHELLKLCQSTHNGQWKRNYTLTWRNLDRPDRVRPEGAIRMPQFSILDRQRTLAIARHECGHYIVARSLGFHPGKLILTMLHPHGHRGESEQALHQNVETKEQILDFLERRAQVLCAGVIAEATSQVGVYDNDAAVRLMREGGGADQDYGKYRETSSTAVPPMRPKLSHS